MPGVQSVPVLRAPRPSPDPLPSGPDPDPVRLVSVEVDGGLDGVLRVATLLRGRGYDVRELTVAIRPDAASLVRCAVSLPDGAGYTLLERLRRLPAVLSAALVEPPDPT